MQASEESPWTKWRAVKSMKTRLRMDEPSTLSAVVDTGNGFSFDWAGSALEQEFAEEKFIPISYAKDWDVVRRVDAAMKKRDEQ